MGVYHELDVWKGSPVGGALPGGVDIATVVKAFLDAPYNMDAENGEQQQLLVVNAMMDYMRNYNASAASDFQDASIKADLINIYHPAMINAVRGSYLQSQGFYPVNTSSVSMKAKYTAPAKLSGQALPVPKCSSPVSTFISGFPLSK
jgi:hypothetical protein